MPGSAWLGRGRSAGVLCLPPRRPRLARPLRSGLARGSSAQLAPRPTPGLPTPAPLGSLHLSRRKRTGRGGGGRGRGQGGQDTRVGDTQALTPDPLGSAHPGPPPVPGNALQPLHWAHSGARGGEGLRGDFRSRLEGKGLWSPHGDLCLGDTGSRKPDRKRHLSGGHLFMSIGNGQASPGMRASGGGPHVPRSLIHSANV